MKNLIFLFLTLFFSSDSFSISQRVQLNDPINVVSSATGNGFTLEVHLNGDLYSYGENFNRQLGLGNESELFYSTPQKVEFFSNKNIKIAQVAAGGNHACVVTQKTFELYCFGRNDKGQLGIDFNEKKDIYGIPQKAKFFPRLNLKIALLALGEDHTCVVVDTTFDLYCFGANEFGQLGLKRKSYDEYYNFTPELVTFFSNQKLKISQLALGGRHTCVVTQKTFELYCFGHNADGQLGIGSRPLDNRYIKDINKSSGSIVATSHIPLKVKFFDDEKFNFEEKRFIHYQDYKEKQNPFRKGKFHALSLGGSHTCVVMSVTYELYCFGDNSNGQLGVGLSDALSSFQSPTKVNYFYKRNILVDQVLTGSYHTCIKTLKTNDVYCFGSNTEGQIGFEENESSAFPIQIKDTKAIRLAVSSISNHTCFISITNISKCFGNNTYGQLGLGNSVMGNYGDEKDEWISKLPTIFYPSHLTSTQSEEEE